MSPCVWISLALLSTVHFVMGQEVLSEQLRVSNSECFGSGQPIECSCDSGNRVLVDKIHLGSNLVSTGCLASWNANLNDDESCCNKSIGDCFFSVDKYKYKSIVNMCNGNGSCNVGVANDNVTLDKCEGDISMTESDRFLNHTNYMYMDFYCIEEDRMFGIGSDNISATRDNTTIYATNVRSPSSVTSYTFAVESADNSTTFLLYKILLDVPCNTSVLVVDRQGSEIAHWTCDNNSYTIEEMNVTSDYIEVHLQNNDSLTEARFWFGFQASTSSNVTIIYPVPPDPVDISSTTEEPTRATKAPENMETYTLYIILAVSIPFVVIFCLLLVITLCCMSCLRRPTMEEFGTPKSITDEEMEKYFTVSTSYEVKTGSVIEVPPSDSHGAPPACGTNNTREPDKKQEMTTEI